MSILKEHPNSTLVGSLLFVATLIATTAIYWPGLTGNFLFDDYPNLEQLGAFGGVNDLNSLYSYLKTGFAGPTGRPISLLSFLIDDNGWPSKSFGFKRTNLLIHLLAGLLLCWTTFRLLMATGYQQSNAAFVAAASAGIWLLHPYFLSTTLYVVQRMAQLAALFSLAGIIGYLHGRQLLSARPKTGYIWMSVSLGLGTLLATLSKENGALLPLLVLVMEFTLVARWTGPKPHRNWQAVFLWVPSLAVLGYLATKIDFNPDLWPFRRFDQLERLMSEARILWEYLFHLVIPRIEGRGLFQDGYNISSGLLSPPQTLLAVIGILLLLAAGIQMRKRWPFISLAILFFLAGHIIESTVIGLELYFEHRNYLPAVFLFLPLAIGLEQLANRFRPRVALTATIALFLILGFLTSQRAQLWKSATNLQLYWAVNTPESPRAQNAIAQAYTDKAQFEKSIAHLEQARERIPGSPLLNLSLLLHKMYARVATERDFLETAERIVKQPFDAQAIKATRTMVNMATTRPIIAHYVTGCLSVLNSLTQNDRYTSMPMMARVIPYLQGRLYLTKGDLSQAMQHYLVAMEIYGETDATLTMVTEMASHRHYPEALLLLEKAKQLYSVQSISTLKRAPTVYEMEFSRIENMIRSDMNKHLSIEQ